MSSPPSLLSPPSLSSSKSSTPSSSSLIKKVTKAFSFSSSSSTSNNNNNNLNDGFPTKPIALFSPSTPVTTQPQPAATTVGGFLGFLSVTADTVMVIGTSPGWVVQLRSVLHTGSASGFSWQTAVLLLMCYTLRVGYYFGEHFHIALLLQCVVMITVVISLIAALIDAPDSATPLTKYQFRNIAKSDPSNVNESTQVTEDEFETYIHSAEEEEHMNTLHPILSTVKRIFDKLFKRRWAGGAYYFGFIPWEGPNTKYVYLTYLTILGIICYICNSRLPGSPFWTKVIGFVALGVEGSVLLPQVYMMEKRRSVAGLSKFLVGTWFCGDLMKVLYFLAKSQAAPFVVSGLFQFALDLFIIGQFARFKVKNVVKQVDGVTLRKL